MFNYLKNTRFILENIVSNIYILEMVTARYGHEQRYHQAGNLATQNQR